LNATLLTRSSLFAESAQISSGAKGTGERPNGSADADLMSVQDRRQAWQREMEKAALAAWFASGTRVNAMPFASEGTKASSGGKEPQLVPVSSRCALLSSVYAVSSSNDLASTATPADLLRVQGIRKATTNDQGGNSFEPKISATDHRGLSDLSTDQSNAVRTTVSLPWSGAAFSGRSAATAELVAQQIGEAILAQFNSSVHPSQPNTQSFRIVQSEGLAPVIGTVGVTVSQNMNLAIPESRTMFEEAVGTLDDPVDASCVRSGEAQLQNEASEQLRVHVQWSANGLQLWLGANTELSPHMDLLIFHLLRWFESQKLNVVSVVCNGKLRHHSGDVNAVVDVMPDTKENLDMSDMDINKEVSAIYKMEKSWT
jgi:hypothetical protein